jgi:ABC-type uncharacterized transport system involved in gliding motility auxiliary subunit
VTPIASSSTNSYGETSRDRAAFDEDRDLPGPRTLMVVANRRLEADGASGRAGGENGSPGAASGRSRIALVGDSDFATNSFFHFLGNGNLFLNTVNYLAAQENLIGIEPRTYDQPTLSLTNRQMKGTFFLAVILMPAMLAVVGTAVWWRQR